MKILPDGVVYVATRDFSEGGGEPLGAFTTLEAARDHFLKEGWTEEKTDFHDAWFCKENPKRSNGDSGGYQEVHIDRVEVKL